MKNINVIVAKSKKKEKERKHLRESLSTNETQIRCDAHRKM